MEFTTFEQLKDELIGKIGTPERDEYESKLKLEIENDQKYFQAISLLKELDLTLLEESCNKKEYNAVKVLRKVKFTKLELE
jgi:hypothetical protein